MSTLKIEERITVKAPPERVWAFLLSPEDIVTCLPGAGLDEIEDARNFHGNVKVKVGPVTVAYKGKATLTDVDDDKHHVTMLGEGKEKGGAGKVKMSMQSRVEAVDGGSEVVVEADVELAGKVVRFGRGMIQGVSKEVFKQFGERLRAKLEVEGEGEGEGEGEAANAPTEAAPAEAEAPEATETTPEEAETEEAKTEEAAPDAGAPEPSEDAPAKAEVDDDAPPKAPPRAEPVPFTPEHESVPVEQMSAKPSKPAPMVKADEEQEAMNAFGLIFRVLFNGIANFFRRLLGKPEKY